AADLKRGKVECRISLNRAPAAAALLALSAERIGHLAQAAVDVQRQVPGAAPLSVAEILRWPGVLAEPTLAPETLAALVHALAAGGSAGKRLDFLMQELHREANTLGSKSVDAELSQASLELKVLIEQMREQVQNLE